MYNFSGLYVKLGLDLVLLIIALIMLICKRPWQEVSPYKKIKSELGAIVFFLCLAIWHASAIISPDIKSFTGMYVGQSNNTRRLEYIFEDTQGDRMDFTVSGLARSSLFPENGLEEGTIYTVHYEKATDMIVGVEITE